MTTDDAWDRYDRGCAEFHARAFAAAAASFEEAAAALPAERSPWYNLGVACLHEGDRIGGFAADAGDLRVVSPNDRWYVRAIEAFTRALAIEPTYLSALVMRGHARRNRLDLEHARADWTEAQRLGDPHAARLLAQLDGAPRSARAR